MSTPVNTLAQYVRAQGWPPEAIYGHLHRHSVCSDNCTRLEDIASPDHARCIEHLKGLNAFHLANIIAKART